MNGIFFLGLVGFLVVSLPSMVDNVVWLDRPRFVSEATVQPEYPVWINQDMVAYQSKIHNWYSI